MLTGFNKIGSLERGRPRAKQFCVFAYVSECVCVCCAPGRDRAWMCVSVQQSALFVMYTVHHVQCSVCVCSQWWRKQFRQYSKCTTNRKYKSQLRPNISIPSLFTRYLPCTALQNPQILLSLQELVFSDKSVIVYWVISAEIIWTKATLTAIKHWYYSIITLSELYCFLLTQHVVILRHDCDIAHSAWGNWFSSTANESNPAAWCVVQWTTKTTWLWWKFAHSARFVSRLQIPPSLHDYVHWYTNATYCMMHEPQYLETSLIPY